MKNRRLALAVVIVFAAMIAGLWQSTPAFSAETNAGRGSKSDVETQNFASLQSAIRNPQSAIKKHWAFVKPERPARPEVKNRSWVRTPIDRFVLARLEKEGLAPQP
ncbi:MAG TPA: hypothetical protein VFY40_14525, partial [Blastocatellia bacterium]|nr:hypothetical protein [Blastocatellia bacterium]